MSWRKKLVPFLVVVMAFAVLASGCTRGPRAASEQILRYNLGTEPETLDSAMMTGVPEFNVIIELMEGLTRIGPDGRPVPGVAERWEILEDGTKFIFHLRDCKWTNGDPVTARDFEAAWKKALDPEVGAEYAYQMYYVKNGEKYNSGECGPDEVGVKAVNDRTLEVTLEAPAGYFLSLTAFQTYFPQNQKVAQANPDWWTKPETFVGNGPFKLKKWDHHSVLEMEKSETYWDAKSVKLDKLVFYMVEESSTELTMFETGEIDFGDNPPLPDIDRLKAEKKLGVSSQLGTYYYLFNVDKAPLHDPRVRKALCYAIDRQSIVDKVTKGGQVPALAYVPFDIPDAAPDSDFRKVGGNYFKDNDVAEAKKLLAEAGYADGNNFPSLELLYNTSEAHKMIAETIQEMWKQSLGITGIKLANQEWGVYLSTRTQGEYEIARAGWLGDYVDPMTFLDMWVTGGGNNDTNWGDAEYDQLVSTALRTTDPKERFRMMHEMEKILMRDMPIAPIYYYVDLWVIKDYVRDVYFNPLGPKDFKWAWIAEK